jgi:hypothetical protein
MVVARARLLSLTPLGRPTLETLHPAAGVDQLLTPSVEGMAFRADLDVKLGLRGAGHELVPAGAADVGLDVFRMDFWLHGSIKDRGSSKDDQVLDRCQAGSEDKDRERGKEDQDRDDSGEHGFAPDPGLKRHIFGSLQ